MKENVVSADGGCVSRNSWNLSFFSSFFLSLDYRRFPYNIKRHGFFVVVVDLIDLEIRDHLSSSCLKTLVPLNESHRDQLVVQSKEFDKAIIEERFRKYIPTQQDIHHQLIRGEKWLSKLMDNRKIIEPQ